MKAATESSSRLRESAKIGIGFLITVLALYLFFKSLDLKNVLDALKKVNITVVLLGAGLTILSLFLRALRFKFMLPNQEGADKRNIFPIVTIAFMVNNLLPARIGEAARAYLLYKKNRFTVHVSIGALLVERILDSLFFALFIVIPSLVLMPVLEGKKFFGQVDVMTAVRLGWVIAVGVLAVLLIYRIFPKLFFGLGETFAHILPTRLGKGVEHLVVLVRESTEWMFVPRMFLPIFILSPCVIIVYALIILALANTMGIELGFWAAVFCSAILAFGVAVPSSPGFVGTLHLALREGLCVFGVDRNTASALAILYHLITWTPVVIAGLFFYFRLDVNFKEIRAAKTA